MTATKSQAEVGGRPIIIETGHMAKQASGSVLVRQGDTVVLVTAQASNSPRDVPFLPLTVEYRESMYAAGKVPGGFFKREGRPNEKETLTCRLIDRPLRPLFPKGWAYETQIIAMVLSADKENNPDVLALTGASTALSLSDIPWDTPIAAVRVALVDGEYVINPLNSQLQDSTMDLVVAASRDGIVMVESGSQEASEEEILEGLYQGQQAIQTILDAQLELASSCGKTKREHAAPEPPAELKQMVLGEGRQPLADAMMVKDKAEGSLARQSVYDTLAEKLPEDDPAAVGFLKELLDEMQDDILHEHVLTQRKRLDGRDLDEIRKVTCEVGVLPRTHGSALFTRGETQALVVTTLGTSADTQRIDSLEFDGEKRFMLHYNFPPFSVGEVRFLRGPGRREIGHGALAERALRPLLPSEDDFPYTIRIVSDILESNGSSSMASVCGGSLSLFDAGAPLRKPVAGIAMGLVMGKDGEYAVLTDIAGAEDHHGDMDFKVAGTRDGVTALQMDIKIAGVTREIMSEALAQARRARLELLDKMSEALDTPRSDISRYAPRILTIRIPREKIRDVIGPGGKIIRSIQEKTGCEISIEDDGRIDIASVDLSGAEQAAEIIKELTAEAELGKIYLGKVVRTTSFGAFVEILPGVDGLLHISEIAEHRVKNTTDEIEEGDEVLVKVIDIDGQGRVRLSRRAAMKEREGEDTE